MVMVCSCLFTTKNPLPLGTETETPNRRLHLQYSPKCTRSVDAYQWIGGQATYCLGPSLGPRPHATRSVATGSKGRKTKVPYGAKSPWVHGCTGRLPKADTWAQDKTGREGRNTAVFRRYRANFMPLRNGTHVHLHVHTCMTHDARAYLHDK